jgi:excinuclease ABC subunit C
MLAVTNAQTALTMQKKSVLADLNSRSQALQHIADSLNLNQSPLRIECVDVSHLQGTSRVAAVVVFEDGLPARSEYRSYVLQQPGDDLAGIREVIERRIERFQNTRTRYPLGLLVIDGGPWQAQAALEVLQAHGLDIPVVGLAKRLEELWLPAATTPIMLPRDSQALYLLQQLRDETHRRAISHHRNRRSKQAVASILDEIVGVGPERRKMLLKHFGGATGLRAAGVSDLMSVKGISPKLAEDIYVYLHSTAESLPESEGEDN